MIPGKQQNAQRAAKIFAILAKQWPQAKCELEYNNNFQLLLAVVLSAQATDKSVNKALASIYKINPQFSPGDLLQMGEKNFLEQIRSIGLAPTKAKNCIKFAGILVEQYAGAVPLERIALESLPGVGRKTANVVLNVLCNLPVIAVDTHVERVAKRLGLASPGASRTLVEEVLMQVVPTRYVVKAHHQLIFHGRYLCTARKPQCDLCPLTALCPKINV